MGTVDDDVTLAREWWAGLAPGLPDESVALWFGIVELVQDGETARHLYVAGCDEFDADDETGDWACDPVWLTGANYLALPGLAAVPDDPYTAQLEHAVEVVRALAPHEGTSVELEAVAVGFDDGDFEVVWTAG